MDDSPPLVCVDLGKTHCRVRVIAGTRSESMTATGLPGLGTPGAAAAAAEKIRALVGPFAPLIAGGSIAIGAAGAWSAPGAAADLAQRMQREFEAAAAVASDVVTAHVGAFAGDAGVCVIVGTGAVALAVAADGRSSLRDGRGLAAGDFGSGAWLGRQGLRAAELAQAGVGAATSLADRIADAAARFADAATAPDTAARLAAHAPMVVACARAGDAVSAAIVDQALEHLTMTAAAAAADVGVQAVAVVGGVADDAWFRGRLEEGLAAAGLVPRVPAGDALAGAGLVAARTDLPLERSIHRARA
ncbi:BadF/BadG/BcrA/BcrD ATPase family protein [Microbacterium kribbense]|uniref:BadF/BadG/BcrA/BcrD ATPase family protein n=1 Tax=Microbacterium kribbense TaxID=433645 RepID=A0ABP7GFN3_9MICO